MNRFDALEGGNRRNSQVAGDLERRVRRLEQDIVVDGDRVCKIRSPNGTYFGLVVNDAGALSTVNLGTTL